MHYFSSVFRLGSVVSLLFFCTACSSPHSNQEQIIDPASITQGGAMLRFLNANVVPVTHPNITDWFVRSSQLCSDTVLLNSTLPCSQIAQTLRFTTVYNTPKAEALLFTIQSTVLTPDTAIGVFIIESNTVKILTNYYVGNEVLSVSPNGLYAAVQTDCFEARCAIHIVDISQATVVAKINAVEFLDQRQHTAKIERWVSSNSVEFTLRTADESVVLLDTIRW